MAIDLMYYTIMKLSSAVRRICALLATVFYISTSAAGKTIEVYNVDDMLKASTNTASGPFELILHNDIGVTGQNSGKKWTNLKSLYFRSNYTIKSAEKGDYSISFTSGGKIQLQEAFDLCDKVIFENLHNVTLGDCSDVSSYRDFNDAVSSGYDSETGAFMHIEQAIFRNLTGKLKLSDLSFYSGTMGGDGMNAATASLLGIGLACTEAEFRNVAKGIEFSDIRVIDQVSTVIPWQRWIEMCGVVLAAKDVTFADNGTSIVFSGNYIDQAWENAMEGLGFGAAAYMTGTTSFSNNAGALTFSGNMLKMATVGCGAALYLGYVSKTTITGQHRDDAAGIDALISFEGNHVDVLQNDGSQLTEDMYAYGGAVSLGFTPDINVSNASLSITENDCNVIFSRNYIDYYFYEAFEDEDLDVHGGAVYVNSGATLSVTENRQVEFSDNYIKLRNTVDTNKKRRNALGGALYLGEGATAEFADNEGSVIFANNSITTRGLDVKGCGGAIYVADEASLLLRDNGVDDPRAMTYGAVFKNNRIRFEDENGSFTLDGCGGAIYLAADASVSFEGDKWIDFTNNAAACGGAIYAGAGSQLFGDLPEYLAVDFQDNTAINGGALYLEDDVTLGIDTLYFGSNSANYGGAFYVDGSIQWNQEQILCTWTHNKADEGAAIYIAEDAGVHISGDDVTLSFQYNESSMAGGGVYSEGNFVVTSVTDGEIEFIYNKGSYGGGVYAQYGDLLFTYNAASLTFAYNEADNGGAIYYFSDASPNFRIAGNSGDISFLNNIASLNGGAITATDYMAIIDNTGKITFSDNQSVGDGSAIYAMNLNIDGNHGKIVFSDNVSSSGSGAISVFAHATINQNKGKIEFLNNKAVYGGALTHVSELCFNKGPILFKGNVVSGTTGSASDPSSVGGAIYVGLSGWNRQYKTLRIAQNSEDVVFTRNMANGAEASGGAVYVDSEGAVIFENNGAEIQFNGNRSGNYGGAIALNDSELTITGTQGTVLFEDNYAKNAGGAIAALGRDSKVSITNNAGGVIFRNNKAEDGGSAIFSAGSVDIRNNGNVLFQGGGTLRSLNMNTGVTGTAPALSLSAPEDATITFDNTGIFTAPQGSGKVFVYLNEDYNNESQSGDIIFTGENSSSRFINTNLTLFNGRLQMSGKSSIDVGGTFTSYSTVEIFNESSLHADYSVEFKGGQLEVRDSKVSSDELNFEGSSVYVENAEFNGALNLTAKSSLAVVGSNSLKSDVHLNDSSMLITGNDSGGLHSRNLTEYPASLCGAIYANAGSTVTLSDNKGEIRFVGSETKDDGGAITLNNSELIIADNTGSLLFENNEARYGGVIAAFGHNSKVSIVNNAADVLFRNNKAEAGASIFAEGCVEICNNENILFKGDSDNLTDIHLRVSEDAVYGQKMLTLSAAEGKTITFDDAHIFVESSENRAQVSVELNKDYDSGEQSGSVVFTNGSSAELNCANLSLANGSLLLEKESIITVGEDFSSSGEFILTGKSALTVEDEMGLLGSRFRIADNSKLTADNVVAIQLQATAENSTLTFGKMTLMSASSMEVADNSTLTVNGNVFMDSSALSVTDASLFTGCKELKTFGSQVLVEQSELSVDGAISLAQDSSMYLVDGSTLKGSGSFVLAEGSQSSLLLRDASVERLISLNGDTTLVVQGFNTVNNLAVDGAEIVFNVGAEHNATTAALDFSINTSITLDPRLLDVTSDEPLAAGRYALLSTGYDESGWVDGYDETIQWTNGVLTWDKGTLYWIVTGITKYTWCNGAGNMEWSTDAANWSTRGEIADSDYIVEHEDGHVMYFGDTAAGEVNLVGELKPGHITVYNSLGNNYTFSGTGSLSGDTMLAKKGTGTLTIATANSFTGGTNIYGGILETAHASALGSGLVTLHGGVLNISTSISNSISGVDMGGRVLLGVGTSLNATQIDAANENLILIGSGTYNLGDTLDGGLRDGVSTGLLWRGKVSATDASLASGNVDTTSWKNTELNGTTTISGGTLTLGGNVVLNGQIANAGTLLMGGNITINEEKLGAVTLAAGSYQQGNSLTATDSGFLSGGCISMGLVTGTAAGLADSAPVWNVQGYNTYEFDGHTLYATASSLGSEFFVNASDSVSYNGSDDARYTNYEDKRATAIVLNGGTLELKNELETSLGIRAEADSVVQIVGTETNLDAGKLNANGYNVTLAGAGGYTLEKHANTAGEGVIFGADWSGTVNVTDNTYALELDKLGVSGSLVELGEFDHTLANREQRVAANLSSTGSLRLEDYKLELSGKNELNYLVVGSLSIADGCTSIAAGLTTEGESSLSAGTSLSIAGTSSLGGTITLEAGATLTLDGTIMINKDTFTPENAVKDVTGYFVGSSTQPNGRQSGFEAACWDITLVAGGTIIDNGVTWELENDADADFKLEKDGTLHAYGSGVGRVFHVGAEDTVTYSEANAADFVNSKGQQATAIQLNGGQLNLEKNVGDKRGNPFILSTTRSKMDIAADVMLKASQLDASGGSVTLSGSGAYDLETGLSLADGVLLGAGWQGLIYTGEVADGTELLNVGHLGNMNSGVQLGPTGNVTIESLEATDADTDSSVGHIITPGNLTLLSSTSNVHSLTVKGMLTLGTEAAAVTLNADGVLGTQSISLGNMASCVFAGALDGATLNIGISDALLKKHATGSITIMTLAQAYNGSTTLNGVNAENGVRSDDWKMIHTLVWQDAAGRARETTSPSELQLQVRTNPMYVKEKVGVTVHNYSHNGSAGLEILNDAYAELNPQLNTPGGALAGLIDTVDAGKMTDEALAAVAGASSAVLGQALSSDVDRQLRAIRNRSITRAFSRDTLTIKGGGASSPGSSHKYFAWVNAEGNRAEQGNEGTAAGYTLTSWGGTLGAGMQVNEKLTLGVALTGMFGDLKSNSPDHLDGDMDTTYVSVFGRCTRGKWSHSVIGTFGKMSADMNRTAYHATGSYTNTGETDGIGLGLMYEVSREYALSSRRSISPVFNISYRHTEVDGYNERNTDAALQVSKQSLDTMTLGFGARYAAIVGELSLNRPCSFQSRVLAKYDIGDHQSNASVGFLGQATRADIESAELGAFGVEFGAGISVPVGKGSIFADGAVEMRSNYTNFNATVGYKLDF